jgi:hypothetical protein
LEQLEIKREVKDSGKKNVINILSRSGAVIILQPPESEINDWLTCISECTRENATAAQVIFF